MTAPAPGTPEWSRLVTASKVAAILGLSPWESPRSMWHAMRLELPPTPESRPMRRGNMLENAVLDWWLADNPDWEEVARQPVYSIDDWCLATPDMLVKHRDTGQQMLVDAKTTSSDMDWTDEAPAYYVASSMWQLAMAPGVDRVCLATLFGQPFDLRSFYVDRDDHLIESVIDRCREFYDSLSADVAPPLDDHPATYDAMRKLHPSINREAEVQLTADEAAEYIDAEAAYKAAEIRAKVARSVVLERMQQARLATHGKQIIARRQPNKYGVSLVPVAKFLNTETDAA